MLGLLSFFLLTCPAAATQDAEDPKVALKFVLNHPDFPAVRRLWNGIIDALIAKQQIPEALWKEFGREVPEVEEALHDQEEKARHGGAWILARLREDGAQAFNRLAGTYGVADSKMAELAVLKEEERKSSPLPGTLASRLLAIGVDETTFEELYGTVLMMHGNDLAPWFASMSDEDWEVVLKVLVHLRRKGGGKPMATAVGREEAWSLVCRGPWIRGIASALGRAFATEKEWAQIVCKDQRMQHIPIEEAGPPATVELAAIYRTMLRLDKAIGERYFSPNYLVTRPAQLPDPRHLSIVDRDILLGVPGQAGMDRETRCVTEAIVACVNDYLWCDVKAILDREFDSIMLQLIPAVAKHVVEAARR